MKKLVCLALATWGIAGLLLHAFPAQAGVIIYGTRVIYPADQQEVVVRLENKGDRPALVQTWLDTGDIRSTPATAQTPFTVSPPIFRIEPHQQQALRLRYSGEGAAADRESLYWLNVLEVPPLTPVPNRTTRSNWPFALACGCFCDRRHCLTRWAARRPSCNGNWLPTTRAMPCKRPTPRRTMFP